MVESGELVREGESERKRLGIDEITGAAHDGTALA